MNYIYDDGGRAQAGFKGGTGDCGVRAAALATGKPYRDVYDGINAVSEGMAKRHGSARTGVTRELLSRYLAGVGWVWVPTMGIGTGCTVRLCEGGGLPVDRVVIARVSKHFVCVDHGTIKDNHDPRRGSTRCVYGYWVKGE